MAGHSVYGAQGSLGEVDGVHKHHIIVVVVLILQLRLLQNRNHEQKRKSQTAAALQTAAIPKICLRLALLMRGNGRGDQAASFKKKFRGSGQQTQKLQVTEDDGDRPVRHHL